MLLYVDEPAHAEPEEGHRGDALAIVHLGAASSARASGASLEVRVPNRSLSLGPAAEFWPATGAVSRIEIEGSPAAADDRSVFVAIESQADRPLPLDVQTFNAYGRLLRGVARAGYPHLLRIWNYVPRIHETASGIDRYMLFCMGRSEAFAARYGDGFPEHLPAASAVGCPGDTLIVHALASREPGSHVENPRQTAAYRYPERYGPKSPSFARGTVAGAHREGKVFVSGTASIVGHESLYPDDPARQTEQTLRNIEAVLDVAGVPGRGGPLGPRLRSLRIYVRYPAQLDAIRAGILACCGQDVPAAWLQAEICRKELLVEIEATARAGAYTPDASGGLERMPISLPRRS